MLYIQGLTIPILEVRQQESYFGRAGFGNYRELPGTRCGVGVAA